MKKYDFKVAFESCSSLFELYDLPKDYEEYKKKLDAETYESAEKSANEVMNSLYTNSGIYANGVLCCGNDILFKYEDNQFFSIFISEYDNDISKVTPEYVFFCLFMEYQDCGFRPNET